jgi:hypothetical protein
MQGVAEEIQVASKGTTGATEEIQVASKGMTVASK